jgi:N-acetylmuramoyl-L-alanine amidase
LSLPVAAGRHLVVIDPGHGGRASSGTQAARTLSSSNNATSPGGLREKDLTLELSLEIKKQIAALAPKHRGTVIDCVLTRDDDSNPDFARRAAICAATKTPPSAIVSIHFNASDRHDCLGTLAVIRNQKINDNFLADRRFATGLIQATHGAVARYLPDSPARAPISDSHLHGGAGSNFFYQLALHPVLKTIPKCFLEVEFIDRRDVEEKLLQTRKQSFPAIARAVAEYLYQYCSLPASSEPPRQPPKQAVSNNKHP